MIIISLEEDQETGYWYGWLCSPPDPGSIEMSTEVTGRYTVASEAVRRIAELMDERGQ